MTITYEVPHVLIIEADDEDRAEAIAVHACNSEDYNHPKILDYWELPDRELRDADVCDIEEEEEEEEKQKQA
jgi:hypothetical protein